MVSQIANLDVKSRALNEHFPRNDVLSVRTDMLSAASNYGIDENFESGPR